MDGSFACPECGSEVEVRGVAPGRNVRCAFCHRLLEVPFLPRAADLSWKRKRFARPRWLSWAWAALGLVSAVVVVAGAWHLANRQFTSYQERSINHLLESSRKHEANGRFSEALIDLDAALGIAREAGPVMLERLGPERKKRPEIARRDASEILDRLSRDQAASFRLGDWLNLKARAAKDRDLDALSELIDAQFQAALRKRVELDLSNARRAFQSLDVVSTLALCEQIAALVAHLRVSVQSEVLAETKELVTQVVCTHGIMVDVPRGHFIYGSGSYVSDMLPVLTKALERKGYLPNKDRSRWNPLWSHASYRIQLRVSELQEGNYLASENRLTRIEAELTLMSQSTVIWQTKPTARSEVPLPNLPAYLASRVATSRSEEFESLLYNSARGQINEKFRLALPNMPPCAGGPGYKEY
jgi:hypothetical protein